MNNLRDITPTLSGVELLDEKELDVTWNYFNLLANSRETLLFTLTKLSLMPMIDYLAPISKNSNTKVYEELELTSVQALKIQNLNIDLLNIQRVIQLYCSQMYSLSSFSSKLISDLIDAIPEETNVQDIEKFMNTLEAFKMSEIQKGGNNIHLFQNLFKLLFLFLLVIPGSQSNQLTNTLELVTSKNNIYNPYNVAIISEKKENEFLEALEEIDYKQKSIDITRSITVYDKNVKDKYDSLIGTLMTYITQIEPSGKQSVLNMIDTINSDLRGFSGDVEKNCLQLMKQSYDKDIFATWKTLDDIETTRAKIEEAEKMIEEQNSQSISKIGSTTVAAAVSVATGDVFSAAAYLGQAGESLWDLLSSTKKKQTELQSITKNNLQQSQSLSAEDKRIYENKLYTYSKYYCSFGYNLQLNFDEDKNTINVFGDKIDYIWIVNLINVLEENLKVEITTLSVDASKDKSKIIELDLLISTLQRLDILKTITNKLSDIINFSFKSHIMKAQINPSKNTVNEVKIYFDEQLNDLNLLLMKLNEFFPKHREKIEEERQIIEADIELKTLEQNVVDIKSNADNIIQQRAAERYAADMASNWIATESIAKSWVSIGENSIKLAGSTLGGITRELTSAIGEIPKGVISSSLGLLNDVLFDLVTNVSGWLVISVPAFMALLYFGQILNFVKTFTWGGRKMIAIVFGGIVSIYTVIKTPFGYRFRRERVLIQMPEAIEQQQQQQQQQMNYVEPVEIQRTMYQLQAPIFNPQENRQITPFRPSIQEREQDALFGLLNLREERPRRANVDADDMSDMFGSMSLKGGNRITKRRHKRSKRGLKQRIKRRTKRRIVKKRNNKSKKGIKRRKITKRNNRKNKNKK